MIIYVNTSTCIGVGQNPSQYESKHVYLYVLGVIGNIKPICSILETRLVDRDVICPCRLMAGSERVDHVTQTL